MKTRLIEIALIILVINVFDKGLFAGVIIGLALSVAKLIWNKIAEDNLKLKNPYESAANGAAAGMLTTLFKIIL